MPHHCSIFTKAFDSVNPNILQSELNFHETAANVDNVISRFKCNAYLDLDIVEHASRHGSVFGPLLFLIHVQ
jgi:hypothetical protein